MKYSIYDLKKGDLYEHYAGGVFEIILRNPKENEVLGKRVNDTYSKEQAHQLEDIKTVYFLDQS